VGGSFPGATDARECEKLVLPFAATTLELAAASSATVRSAASALGFVK
jgi:hypothetical protein